MATEKRRYPRSREEDSTHVAISSAEDGGSFQSVSLLRILPRLAGQFIPVVSIVTPSVSLVTGLVEVYILLHTKRFAGLKLPDETVDSVLETYRTVFTALLSVSTFGTTVSLLLMFTSVRGNLFLLTSSTLLFLPSVFSSGSMMLIGSLDKESARLVFRRGYRMTLAASAALTMIHMLLGLGFLFAAVVVLVMAMLRQAYGTHAQSVLTAVDTSATPAETIFLMVMFVSSSSSCLGSVIRAGSMWTAGIKHTIDRFIANHGDA